MPAGRMRSGRLPRGSSFVSKLLLAQMGPRLPGRSHQTVPATVMARRAVRAPATGAVSVMLGLIHACRTFSYFNQVPCLVVHSFSLVA